MKFAKKKILFKTIKNFINSWHQTRPLKISKPLETQGFTSTMVEVLHFCGLKRILSFDLNWVLSLFYVVYQFKNSRPSVLLSQTQSFLNGCLKKSHIRKKMDLHFWIYANCLLKVKNLFAPNSCFGSWGAWFSIPENPIFG